MPYWDERRFSSDHALARTHLGEQAFVDAVNLGRYRDLDDTLLLLIDDLRAIGSSIGDAAAAAGTSSGDAGAQSSRTPPELLHIRSKHPPPG